MRTKFEKKTIIFRILEFSQTFVFRFRCFERKKIKKKLILQRGISGFIYNSWLANKQKFSFEPI